MRRTCGAAWVSAVHLRPFLPLFVACSYGYRLRSRDKTGRNYPRCHPTPSWIFSVEIRYALLLKCCHGDPVLHLTGPG